MQTNTRRAILGVTVISAGLLGTLGGYWWAERQDGMSMPGTMESAAMTAGDAGREVLYWYDPMYPQQRFDQPGQSPFMDMALVPRYRDDDKAAANTVRIDARVRQNLGLRLAEVRRVELVSSVDATGLLGFNERTVTVEQARVDGFVERVWPLAPEDVVRAGQPLVELLVPAWAAAQYELLAVRDSGDEDLLEAARQRLDLLGMPRDLIRELERSGEVRSRVVLNTSRAGMLQALEVRAGMSVQAGQTLARINGLESVWLEVAVPEALAERVQVGSQAQVQLSAFPDELFTGDVIAILPTLAAGSRSLRVRVELPNALGRLRPGMSAQVKLMGDSTATALTVPTEAIIRTGKRNVVMLAQEAGSFVPVEVGVGAESGEFTVITAGLEEGQQVVASGQFLLDSEASLNGVQDRPLAAVSSRAALPQSTLHEADATIEALDDGQITLAHGPFESLGMPGMTMTFPLADPDLSLNLKVGDRVRVAASQSRSGLLIERIELSAEPDADSEEAGEQP
ncbi:MAG: efflux RND transporter periplasmic adaptor subunit [Pseudomonadales bacterium]|nr:efflux RND transporter periplasmic adaptor subunit [Pseudomonadales bacterium]